MVEKVAWVRDLTLAKELFEAFSTLSDAQDLMMEMGDLPRSHQEINHAKRHLHNVMEILTEGRVGTAVPMDMSTCSLLKE